MNKLVHPGPAAGQTQHSSSKPLVALLDGRDCTVEMPLLKDIATVAFCDAQLTTEIHEKVLNEAVAALLYSIRLSREDLLKFRSLKVIVKIGNPDVHNVDLIAATELGIAVCNMPAEAVEEAADHTISLILNMFRRTFWVARTVQIGKKLQNMDQLRELMANSKRVRGSTLGIIGFGRIGCAVALRAKALGFRVCFFDPHIVNGMERVIGVDRVEKLVELLVQSDCITLHCLLGQETRHLLNNDSLKRLKSGAFLVNIGEADLIDLKALIGALKSGQIKAVSFDINQRALPNEQFADFESLLNMPNVICTPNCAWFSEESLKEMRISAAKEVRRALTGGAILENLQNCVNKSELLALRMAQQKVTSVGQIGGIHQNGFITNEFGIQQQQQQQQQGMMAPGIGMLLPKNSAIIGQITNQQHGNDISTSSFATALTVGNTSAEYSTIQTPPPPISIDGISSAHHQADSLQNATALLAYQNFMMQNPQLFMAASRLAGGPIPPVPTILPTASISATVDAAQITPAAAPTTTHHHHPSLLSNDFVPTNLNATHISSNASPLATTGNLYSNTSKSPSSSRPSSMVSNVATNISAPKQQQQKPESTQRKHSMPLDVDEATIEDDDDDDDGHGRGRLDMYPSAEQQQQLQQQSSAATTTIAADSPENSPHGRLLIADEREDEDDLDEADAVEA